MSSQRSFQAVLVSLALAAWLPATRLTASPPVAVERWALLIGVDDYANANQLRYCGADQRSLKARIERAGFDQDHIVLMHDKAEESRYRPSQRNIEKQLDLVLGLAGENALVLVAFSGHGVSLDGRSYLCPNDGTLDDPETLVSLDGLYDRLQRCEAAFKLVLVDACRNDPRRGGQRTMSATKGTQALARSLQENRLPDGVVLLNSCAPGEISYEEPDLGHGVFMHYVLQGLMGAADTNRDGSVSLNELQLYAGDKTKTHVARKFNDSQRPFFRGDLSSDALEYALLPVSPRTVPMIDAAAMQALIAETLAAARAIPDAEHRSSKLRFLAITLSRNGDSQVARDALRESLAATRSVNEKDRAFALTELAKAFHRIGDSATAHQVLIEALALARRATFPHMDLCRVAQTAAEMGNSAAATQIFDEAKADARRSVVPGDFLCSVAEDQAEAGMEAAARVTYEEARRLGSSEYKRDAFFGALAEWHAEHGDLKAAYDTARSTGNLSGYMIQSAFADIAEAQVKQGDLKGALATAEWLTAESARSRAFEGVCEKKAEQGDVEGALAATVGISDEFWRSLAFEHVGEAQLARGDIQAAIVSFRSIPDIATRLGCLTLAAVAMDRRGDPAAAGLFDEIRSSLHGLPSAEMPRKLDQYQSGLWRVAGAFAKGGRFDQALDAARGGRTPQAKAYALQGIVAVVQEQLATAAAAEATGSSKVTNASADD